MLVVKLAVDAGITSGLALGAGAVTIAIFGVGMILAYRRYLRKADELLRKIELDALALAVGAGLAGGTLLWLLAAGGFIEHASSLTLMAMALTYIAGLVAGYLRYR